MDWDKMNSLYKGPSIDASYQVSVHLTEGFQRRKLKCEKLTDNGRQVMAKAWQGELITGISGNRLFHKSVRGISGYRLFHKSATGILRYRLFHKSVRGISGYRLFHISVTGISGYRLFHKSVRGMSGYILFFLT